MRLRTAAVGARAVGTTAVRVRRRSGGADEAVGTRREGRGGGRRAARSVGLGGGECGRCRETALSRHRFNRAVGVACGGHAAAARCRTGPAQLVTADKRGPLVGDF
jgi:hypothetical protein